MNVPSRYLESLGVIATSLGMHEKSLMVLRNRHDDFPEAIRPEYGLYDIRDVYSWYSMRHPELDLPPVE